MLKTKHVIKQLSTSTPYTASTFHQEAIFYYFYVTKEQNMEIKFHDILRQNEFSKYDLAQLISSTGQNHHALLQHAGKVQESAVGRAVYLRGLIELSNVCSKNCLYCGIRKDNTSTCRYIITDYDVEDAAIKAWQNHYGSIVIQAGERSDNRFIIRIERLLKQIKEETNGELGITLSLGEQSANTYRRWFEAGAHRYLLRIETTNAKLYKTIHPDDAHHSMTARLNCLKLLKETGYQTGTGVMIGLPGQSYEDLADDLLFFKSIDIDMVGMGPYIEHSGTPLYSQRNQLWPIERRLELALNMIATLRLLMPDINIAAATALQAIDAQGREKALQAGANVIMPNITPSANRKDYMIYENKPYTDESMMEYLNSLNIRIKERGRQICYGKWGDSLHYKIRNGIKQNSHN